MHYALTDMENEALNSVTPTLWKTYSEHVEHTENEYWTTEGIVENADDELE